jgi:hypothetical protein
MAHMVVIHTEFGLSLDSTHDDADKALARKQELEDLCAADLRQREAEGEYVDEEDFIQVSVESDEELDEESE